MTELSPNETTLALHIQEGRATDPAVAAALIKQFAPGVQRFTLVLLNGRSDAPETARALTRQTFAIALNDPDSFAGKDNIRAWLYSQATRQTHALPPAQQARSGLHAPANSIAPDELSRKTSENTHSLLPISHFLALPYPEYLTLLLRYGHRLSLHDIAQLLRSSEKKIHKHLISAREKLIQNFSTNGTQDSPASKPSQASRTHQTTITHDQLPVTSSSHHPRETQRLLDGLLDPTADASFRDHLDTCADCRAYLKRFAELEFHLNTLLYHEPPLPDEEVQDIVHAVIAGDIIPQKHIWQMPDFLNRLPIREMSWVVLAAAIFLLLAWWLNPYFSSPTPISTPAPQPTPTLPVAQNLSTVFRQEDPGLNPFPGQHVIWTLSVVRPGDHIPTTPMMFAPSGNAAAFGVENQVVLWDLINARGQVEIGEHESVITALEFTPDEAQLASGDENGNVHIRTTTDGRLIYRLENHPGPIRSLVYSQNGRYLAVGLNTGIWLWEINTGAIVRVQQIHWEWIRVLSFSPDGKWLAAADRNDSIAIWSIPDGKLLLRYQTLPSPDGQRLDLITRLAFSPDGKKLASGSFNGLVEVVTLSSNPEGNIQGTRLYAFPHPSWISEVRWSPDGRQLAIVSDYGIAGGVDTASRAVYLWEIENGTPVHAPLTARIARGLSRAIFTPQGNTLWASTFDGTLFRWDLDDVSHLIAAVPDPQWFLRTENNYLWEPIQESVPAIRFDDPLLALVGFEVFQLSPLPDQYTFASGNYSVRDSIVELVYQTPSGNRVKITQRPAVIGMEATAALVGASAVIQPVQIHGIMGEYVAGGWMAIRPNYLTGFGSDIVYQWHADGEATLRWIQQGYLMEIQTPLFQYDHDNLALDDLVLLAENLYAQSEPPTFLTYTVQDADTCFGIAQRYGTTFDQIILANRLESCDLIQVGQPLFVPLPPGRATVTELDLNCDGRPERIRAIPDPNQGNLNANFGVVLETIPVGGDIFWPAWQLTVADVPVDFFGLPEVYPYSACEGFLAVSQYGGTGEFSGVDVYQWDGEQMTLVLNAEGYKVHVSDPNQATPLQLTTQSLIRDPAAGGCTLIKTSYQWDGVNFEQTEQTREEGIECFEG